MRGGLVSAGARNRAINNLALTIANALSQYGVGCIAVAPSFAVTINATTVELAGGSSPDIHYELEPHPPWWPGTAR